MAGILSGLSNLFQNPNFLTALLGVGQAMDQRAHASQLANTVANEQQRILANGGSYLDAQRAGQFIQANSPYLPNMMSLLGGGMQGYMQQEQMSQNTASLAKMLPQMLGQQQTGQQQIASQVPTVIDIKRNPPDTDTIEEYKLTVDPKTQTVNTGSSNLPAESLEAIPKDDLGKRLKALLTNYEDPYDQYSR